MSTSVKPSAPLHVFPRREDLVGVAADLARSVGAAQAVLSLDPARFAAGTVGSPGLSRRVLQAVGELAATEETPDEGLFLPDLTASGLANVAPALERSGIRAAMQLPLKGPGGAIGVALLFYDRVEEPGETEAMRLRLQVERAAMNVVNVRLFNLIERAKKEWESTFDAIRDGISIHDRDCRIRRANWGLGMMLGTTPSVLVGQTCHEGIFGRESPCESCPLMPHGSGPFQATEHEDEIDGRAVHVSMYPLILEDGSLSGLVHIVRDISQRKREEQEFRHIHEELVSAHATLKESMQQLQQAQAQLVQSEKMAAVGQLISGVAHELNNPLTGIIGYSQLMGDGENVARMDATKLARFVGNMGREAVRCQKIVQNLLTFARRSDSSSVATDLNDIVRRTVELKAYDLRVNDIALELDLTEGMPLTAADPHQLQQVLLNLVHNASQAIRSGAGRGTIVIHTSVHDEAPAPVSSGVEAERWACLEVRDDGPGFTEEVGEKMFDPFFTTKEVGQGTGLGLSICYGVVKEHHGWIVAERGAAGGAVLRVVLPIVPPDRGDEERPRGGAAPAGARQEDSDGARRVLVVDDEATICDMVRDVLVIDGYDVDVARDGKAGLEAALAGSHDCILADLKMPDVDGPTLYERLRARDPERAERMIFMTGDMLSEGSREFLEGTGNPYLAKPFSIQDLRAAVSGTLADSRSD